MSKRTLLMVGTVLLFAACTPQTPVDGSMDSSSSSSEASSMESLPETRNVTYSGIVTELPSSTVEATHSLNLGSGRTLLMVSTDANLSLQSYLGKKIDARGSIKVVGGQSVLRVSEVVLLTESSSSSSAGPTLRGGFAGFACPAGMECIDDTSDSCDPENGGADCSGICVKMSSASSVSSSQASSASSVSSSKSATAASSSKPAVSSSPSSSSSTPAVLAPNEQDVAVMAKQNYATPGLWTQKYCTSHIAFCVPVHKNWYYKSFGATTSTLWHVEFGMTDIQSLGQGAISLNLISGSSADVGGTDGKVESKGGLVIGYKDWEGGRHIEIASDARLSEAVTYMLEHLTGFTPDQ